MYSSWSFLLKAFLLGNIVLNFISPSNTSDVRFANETDRLALLEFKEMITEDPLGALSSWNYSTHFCQWRGVTCSRRHQRVIALNLESQSLVGIVSPHIGNLSFLRTITLQNNSFHGKIPQEIGRLFRLRSLTLSNNSFQGEITTNLTYCSRLKLLNLIDNKLVGKIPDELSTLSALSDLGLSLNNLTGNIPPSLGNLSSLKQISIATNNLEGSIPEDLGRLTDLEILVVSDNYLTGTIPPTLYNLSNIVIFIVTGNRLHGEIPSDIGLTLPNIKWLFVGENMFTGTIPGSLTNASRLEYVEFALNGLTGPIPNNLGMLPSLSHINFGANKLGTTDENDLNFISSLTNCTRLEMINLGQNLLRGSLPNSLANLSTQIKHLIFQENHIYGSIPSGIGNLINTVYLDMEWNDITGNIPVEIGKLHRLQDLYLNHNRISGQIPSSIGNLTLLNGLDLMGNNLDGPIPLPLGNCQQLLGLSLSHNNLNGSIPNEILYLSSISLYLYLSHNALTGSLPSEVGNLKNLVNLDISKNRLSGSIPDTLGNCLLLENLYMQDNLFEGMIPQSLSALRGLQDLDISHNKLSGKIPGFLGTLPFLTYLNLSFNQLQGEVPENGIFRNESAISVDGNQKLCGGIAELKLPTCIITASRRKSHSLLLKVMTPVVVLVIVLTLLSSIIVRCYLRRPRRNEQSSAPPFPQHLTVSYAELLKATNGFSEDNLIGVGSYGSVYKGILDQNDETLIAVKVLNLDQRGAAKSFVSECEALKNIRHRNLVKILSTCSSIDFQGNEFKALIFEFMPNGSLEKWLHPEANGEQELRKLSFMQRLNIAIDVASALEYLHHHSHATIVHSDLKPGNVLLDEKLTAHLSDFGLANVLSELSSDSAPNGTNSAAIKGSIGYIAPEYGMGGKVSTYGDIYSYGILVLEMFTGRRPTGEMFKDGLSLHDFARMACPQRVMEIMDPLLQVEEDRRSSRIHECLLSVLRIGIACSMESPSDRMRIRDVVTKLHSIKKANDGKLDADDRDRVQAEG
ncbi:PREDICTED: probable LRR receptor-like serine/threonine-protein kinase At3g47570 [Nelumbo nucifera]|uniref:non-specific serine/threonine protein kinase n=1 Tax=Nelumbo nucifera TaxID=4432 RepID=A0A1U8B1A8_NELNU|nr:PREDICTED: probable LRR receptor-like serine/threonine-protein kinase At3g47570 [Nelumbo nucifera]